ncbi:CRACD-like protein [Elgaria multicarinata webbii]|uniref:CRACD-like protein n=1 Tax=Elgaria multicarinata webbii TaxID=159646 RepID=UPI002FCCC791
MVSPLPGKKKSKFKSIKKFFGKRKRKETLSSSGSVILKTCQSASDVTASQTMHIDSDSEDDLEMHRSVMGNRALSHDSIFIPEASQEPATPVRVFSQENVSDRIRALQLKLQQNCKLVPLSPFGSPSKRMDDAGMSSEDDGLPRSPPETSLLQEILNSSTAKFSDSHKHLSSLSLAGTGSEEEEQVTSSPLRSCSTESQLFPRQSSTKIITPQTSDCSLSPPADFDIPPESSSCLDNSAAKHKLLVKPRNQRSSRTRRQFSRNLSNSQNNLSCTPEEDESDRKEMLVELIYEGDGSSRWELTKGAAPSHAVCSQQPEMSNGLQHNLSSQDEKVCMLPSTSEPDSLPCENKPVDCQTMQGISCSVSLSSPSDPKEDITSIYLSPDQEKKPSKMPNISPGNLSGMSLSISNQENRCICDMPSRNDRLSDKKVSAKTEVIPALEGTERNVLKDAKALLEDIYNKGIIKGSPSLPSSVNLLPKDSFQHTDLPDPENSSISQTSGTAPSLHTATACCLTLDKKKPTPEQSGSDKENHHPSVPGLFLLGGKTKKEASDPCAVRKFSVSSARGRSRTSSLNMKETLECENPLAVQVLQTQIKNSSRNDKVKEDVEVKAFQERENGINKQIPPSEPEIASRALDKVVAVSLPQAMGSKPTLNTSSCGVPQQSSAGQSSCEDKNPFQVKLRSTSFSLKYRDNVSPDSKETQRHSAEFNLEKEGLPLSSLKGEKAASRKTTDVNINNFVNESLKIKPKSSEQGVTKPPLPRKPVLQHFTIPGTSTSMEKQEKITKYSEFKNEDKDLEKKPSPSEVPEKSVPSPAVDTPRAIESQTMPAWITIAKQKQRLMEQELSKEEKTVAKDKADAEKHIKEKERMEEPVRQQTDFTRNTSSFFPPTVFSDEQKKEIKLDMQEPLPRASLLSHHSPVQSSVPIEKEDIKPQKKVRHSSPDKPSWMELAKKKSQAWSDMPQKIK